MIRLGKEKQLGIKQAPSLFGLAIILVILYVMLGGCVKKVYVGEPEYVEAVRMYDQCRKSHLACEDLLEECIELGQRLEHCP